MRRALFVILLLLALALPPAGLDAFSPVGASRAQAPFVAVDVTLNQTFVSIPNLGNAIVGFTVEDVSFDGHRVGAPKVTYERHVTYYRATILTPNATGWIVSADPMFTATKSGEVAGGTIYIAPGATARPSVVTIGLEYNVTYQNGSLASSNMEFVNARILPNYLFQFQSSQGDLPVKEAGQFDTVTFSFTVSNLGNILDTIELSVDAPDGFQTFMEPRIYLEPGESRRVNLTVVTPHDTIYELQKTGVINVKARSVGRPGVEFAAVAIVKVSGPYLPLYYVPLSALALLCVGLAVQRTRDHRARGSLEKGGPRPLRLTPRQQIVLKTLKRSNPDAYKLQMERLATLYAARKQSYRVNRKEHLQEEREARKESERLLKEEKARRAEQEKIAKKLREERAKIEKVLAAKRAKERKAQEKVERAAAKKQAKLDKRQAKLDAKERKRLGKVLKRKQAALKKAQAKAAKAAAKQAKVDAKAAAKAAKAAAKAAKGKK